VGYKWLGEEQAQVATIDQFPKWFNKKKGLNDKGLVDFTLDLMEEAEVIVAHYGDRFDRPFFNGRCLLNGFRPPAPAKQRDTWDIARKTFKFSGNRLAHLADILKVSEKKYHKQVPGEWPGWWLRALAGDEEAIHDMAKYCRQDVQTLEKVYLKLQPYDQAHPRVVEDRSRCKICGGIVEYRGTFVTKDNSYRRFVCRVCGHWGRDTKKAKE